METINYFEIPIIDTHVHFLFPGKVDYIWNDIEVLKPIFKELTEDMYNDINSKLNIKGLMYMEVLCPNPTQEAKFIENLANNPNSKICGIVPHIPMFLSLEEIKNYFQEIKHLKLKSARFLLDSFISEEDIFYLKDNFFEKLEYLSSINLSFTLSVVPKIIHRGVEIAEKNPKVTFVLDHLGKPFIGDDNLELWKENMEKFSKLSNVYLKLSPGYCYPENFMEKSRECIIYCIEKFSKDNLIVGSDFGHGTNNVPFFDWMSNLFTIFEEMKISKDIAEKILYKNAEKLFQLEF